MAGSERLTAREAASNVLAIEHADILRESVALMVHQIMEAEIAQLAGAEHGERAPDRRHAQRNGYRERRWDTRVGEIELAIPKLRTGSYLPSFLEPRRRAEQALVAVVQEAYVHGVSTRKVDRLVEQMGLRGLSKDQVSRICRGLDQQVSAFRSRPLDGEYPYLWLDAKIERVREPGGVRHKALVIAYAVHESGIRSASAFLTQRRSASWWMPRSAATRRIGRPDSWTIPTARSRSSGGYLLGLPIVWTPFFQAESAWLGSLQDSQVSPMSRRVPPRAPGRNWHRRRSEPWAARSRRAWQ